MTLTLSEQLLKKDELKLYEKECFEKIKNEEKVIIFGVGKGGINTYEFLKKHNFKGKIECFCDNDSSNWNNDINGIKVISPYEMTTKYSNEKIIITCSCVRDVKKQLNELGINDKNMVNFDFINIDWINTGFQFIIRNIKKFEQVYNLLDDKKSREVFSSLLNYKISRNYKYLVNISDDESEKGFDKTIINLKGNEVFIDGGSYTGDTLVQFIKFCNKKYKKCICFEVKKHNFDMLIETIERYNLKNVEAKCVGLWNENTNLRFKKVGSGSGAIDENGSEIVEVDTIDNILNGKKAEFIKLDIEGSEKNAILGATETIKRYNPILAVSVYSKIEELFEIPILISNISQNYKFYFRHYNKTTDISTVCYAVPISDIKK